MSREVEGNVRKGRGGGHVLLIRALQDAVDMLDEGMIEASFSVQILEDFEGSHDGWAQNM